MTTPAKLTVPVPVASAPPASGILKVSGKDIVTQDGKPIVLRGAGLGGHLNMENFITGYPGHEYEMRAAMKKALGEDKYNFFFNRFLQYFFEPEDAKLFASLGFNCIRIPFNYRHFEDNLNPGKYIEEGFLWLDRIINICAAEGVYTILDLHTVPGGQSPGWHCDSGLHKSLFWEHAEFQERAINLWVELAKRYEGNAWVAGYNPLNEPCDEDPEITRLLSWYNRVEKAIRAVDPDHILWWDGNTFAADFSKFLDKPPLPNSVYACHDYSGYGFPDGERYKGTPEQKEKLRATLERKIEYQVKIGGPVWNGEWGPVYAGPDDGADWQEVNEDRYKLLGDQLAFYEERQISWSIWLWKDIGFQGMVYASPNSAYMKRLRPFLLKKKELALDAWGCDSKRVAHIFDPIEEWMLGAAPGLDKKYPSTWNAKKHIRRVLREMLLSEALTDEYASYFKDLSYEELDTLAASFKLENCLQRKGLNDTIRPKN